MAGASKRRSVRQAATRKRSMYLDPDTDDDFEAQTEEDPEPRQVLQASRPRKRRKDVRARPQTRSKVKIRPVEKVIGKPRKANSQANPPKYQGFSGPSDGRIPPWTSLPFEILRDIFIYASLPNHQPSVPDMSANTSWLLRAARTCRSFAMPALEAYYQSPALLTSLQPHEFLELLRLPKEKKYIDYNVKVHSFIINVMQLAYLAPNKPPFNLAALMEYLPQLQHFEIIHTKFSPPYRDYRSAKTHRWSFPVEDVVRVMNERGILLKCWRWSRDCIPKNSSEDLYGMMTTVHTSKVFSYLTRLIVCGFNVNDSSEPDPTTGNEDMELVVASSSQGEATLTGGPQGKTLAPIPGLATSIAVLPALKDLTFVSCDVIMNNFLERLPDSLERLELSNCLEITSEMITKFLNRSGGRIRELVFNHNPALNLSFLQTLKLVCPRLQVLKVDMQYYSERLVTNDAEAFYDQVLAADEIPSWSTSLRHLELIHAQKWSADGAQNVFGSLIDAASDLPDLRSLILHTHINIPWRDRVDFRDQWTERLRRVFERHSKDPSPYMGSLKQIRQSDHPQAEGNQSTVNRSAGPDEDIPITRTMAYVQVSPHRPSGDTDVYSESDGPEPSSRQQQPRRSRRVADNHMSQASQSASPALASDSEDEDEGNWRKQPEKFIQGLCDVVDVRIDNQRPRENQWTEGDFLDSEKSGDEDYHEGDEFNFDSTEEESYAW